MDLTKLNSNVTNRIEINDVVDFPKAYYEHTSIKELSGVKITGVVSKDYNNDYIINVTATGNMMLEDAVTLDLVPYAFDVNIEDEVVETSEKDSNSLDIMEILWQNIILEIPLKYTEVDDLSNFHGDGWKVISEEDINASHNPFQDLKSKLGEE